MRRLDRFVVVLLILAACGSSAEPAERVTTTISPTSAATEATTTTAATPSTETTAEAAPEASTTVATRQPAGDLGTRSSPIAAGSLAAVGDWLVRVVSVEEDGTDTVLADNDFNDPPLAGQQFYLIGLEAAYQGEKSASFWGDMSWLAVGPSSVAYEGFDASCGFVPDDLSYAGEVFPGGVVTGNLCFAVEESDVAELQLALEAGFSGERTFFSLQPGVGSDAGVELPSAPELDVSGPAGTHGNPVALGSIAGIGDWFVQVTSVTPDATNAVLAQSDFNEPPSDGNRFFLVELDMDYAGAESGAPGGSVQLQLVGPDRVAIDTFSNGCGFVAGEYTSLGELFPGGSVSTVACFEAPAGSDGDYVIVADSFGFDQHRAFLALSGGVGTPTDTTVPPVDPPADADVGTWTNPHPAGSTQVIGDWEVTVAGVDLDATDAILVENSFNEPPPAGRQYVLIALEATYRGAESGSFWSDLSWSVLGPGRVAYSSFNESCGSIPDEMAFAPEVFTGGAITGNICFSVPAAEVSELVLILEEFGGFDEPRVFLSLD